MLMMDLNDLFNLIFKKGPRCINKQDISNVQTSKSKSDSDLSKW